MPTVIFGTNPKTGQLFIDHSVDTFARLLRRGERPGRLGRDERQLRQPHPRHRRDQRERSSRCATCRATTPPTPAAPGEWRGCSGHALRQAGAARRRQIYTYVVGMQVPDARHRRRQAGRAQPARRCAPDSAARARRRDHGLLRRRTQPGERYEYRYGGGGGWGDPLERDPQKVLDDVLDEYVSVEAARRDYGVVLTGSLEEWTLAIDRAATEALRARDARGTLTGGSLVRPAPQRVGFLALRRLRVKDVDFGRSQIMVRRRTFSDTATSRPR